MHHPRIGIVTWALCLVGSACALKSKHPEPEYAACNEPSDCVVVPASCCGTCGAPTHGDAIAIARDQNAAYRADVCDGLGCPACAPLFIDPTLVATCDAGKCALVDWRTHSGSACSVNADCNVRTPDCCPCGGDTSLGRLIGVSSEPGYAALVCDSDQACAECEPIYPPEVTASCNDLGHCETHDGRLPFMSDAGVSSLAACELNGTVFPSGTHGLDDPISCNTCTCFDGALQCTEVLCPQPCGSGTTFGTRCAQCGPVDNCEIVRIGCLPPCTDDTDCALGETCTDHLCGALCG